MNLEKRNVVTCVLLSIVTCAIYMFYWIYKVMSELYELNGQESKAGMDIVLSIVTCGIYTIYMYYKMAKLIDSARVRYGMRSNDDSVLFVILSIFGLSIVALCIVQSSLNNDLIPVAGSVEGFAKSYDDDRRN